MYYVQKDFPIAIGIGSYFIPIVGPVISIGLGVADSYGAFDNIYNYFE